MKSIFVDTCEFSSSQINSNSLNEKYFRNLSKEFKEFCETVLDNTKFEINEI